MPVIPPIKPLPRWHCQEFISPGDKPTPMAGINAAVAWLNENSVPPIGTVVGNTDGKGDVRLFWYGIEIVPPVLEQ